MPKPSMTIDQLAAAVWRERLERQPYLPAYLGLPVERIAAPSLEAVQAEAGAAREFLAVLNGIDRELLAPAQRLTWDFLEHALRTGVEAEGLWWSRFDITPYCGKALTQLPQLIFGLFSFGADADADRYLRLMDDYAGCVRSVTAKLKLQVARGWVLPTPALPGALATLRGARDLLDGIFRVDASRLARVAQAQAFHKAAQGRLQDQIKPAFDELLAYVEGDYARVAPEGVGLSQYPGGLAAYQQLLRYHLTEDVDPRQLHELGLAEVEAISQQMAAIRRELGASGDEARFHRALAESGRLHARQPEDVERCYAQCMARIEPHIASYFSILPRAPYAARRLDAASEAGMSYGYYQPPTGPDVPGYYLYNGSGLDTRCQLTAPAIIYHELVPGHHFHIARQRENAALPDIRRNAIELTVFNEGWAEYASDLAGEMGMYADPYDRYGRLLHERFIAQRLVVDTGLNAFGWPLEKARAYMKANTLESDTQVATETLRYATDLPGQAPAYRYGYLKFKALRRKAEQVLGAGFDIKAYHEAILGAGALPFPVLEKHLDAFIQQG